MIKDNFRQFIVPMYHYILYKARCYIVYNFNIQIKAHKWKSQEAMQMTTLLQELVIM